MRNVFALKLAKQNGEGGHIQKEGISKRKSPVNELVLFV